MTNQHPITPPPKLVQEWFEIWNESDDDDVSFIDYLSPRAAHYGADQELEACCEWLQNPDLNVDTYKLRAARRPKPPSLKEQAIAALNEIEDRMLGPTNQEKLIRRALEAMPDD
jgi:hypothetical protein